MLNIGSDEEIIDPDAGASGSRRRPSSISEIVFIPYDEAYGEGFEDMPRRVPDLTKIERMMGWRPRPRSIRSWRT